MSTATEVEFEADFDLEGEVEFELELDLDEPSQYHVVMHNDDRTPMDFVVLILTEIFHHDEADAVKIMLRIHEHGRGIAGTFTHEIAEEKAAHTTHAAQSNGFPLAVTVEEA